MCFPLQAHGIFHKTLGSLWGRFGVTLDHFGVALADFKALWDHFGARWVDLGVMLEHLGVTWGVISAYKIVSVTPTNAKTNEN